MRTAIRIGTALALAAFLVALPVMGATASRSVTGSEDGYQTFVERSTEGELSDQDFRQVSLLTSLVVGHVNAAVADMLDDQADRARAELDRAQTLIRVIRDILPVTRVETVVKDPRGNEVYRHDEEVQDDRQTRIAELSQRIAEPGTVDALRRYWGRVTGWMRPEPGEAQPSES